MIIIISLCTDIVGAPSEDSWSGSGCPIRRGPRRRVRIAMTAGKRSPSSRSEDEMPSLSRTDLAAVTSIGGIPHCKIFHSRIDQICVPTNLSSYVLFQSGRLMPITSCVLSSGCGFLRPPVPEQIQTSSALRTTQCSGALVLT